MRLSCFPVHLASLLGLASATLHIPPTNTTTLATLLNGWEPWNMSVAAHLEGLPGCWVRCFIAKNKYFHTDMGLVSFKFYCGSEYWNAIQDWEEHRVRPCARRECVTYPCAPGKWTDCDIPEWMYQKRFDWLVKHCEGLRYVPRPGMGLGGKAQPRLELAALDDEDTEVDDGFEEE